MAARVEYCNRLALIFSVPIFNNARQWPMHRVRKQILAATHSSQSQSSRLSLSLSLSLSSQWALAHAGPLKCHACVWTTGHKTWRALLHEIHELFTLQRLYKRSLATSSRLACLKGACAGSQADLFAELQKYTGDTYISNMGLMALCPRSDLQLICMFPAQ